MSKQRQLRKQEEIKNVILAVARSIVANQGIDGLSIRKITKEIDYSPGIIYHYFKDKNEIIEILLQEGYGRILASVGSVTRNEAEPEKEIQEIFTRYIKAALASTEEYKAFMLNDDPRVLQHTGLLKQGVSKERKTVQILTSAIQRGMDQGRFTTSDPELVSQILWTSTFGLIIKLIIEKDVDEDQINRLIEQHFTLLFNGMMIRKENEHVS